jgi:phosphoribulokinase
MSSKHPIVAITGSSGSGSTSVTTAVQRVLGRLQASYVIVDGDGFHRYDRFEHPRVMERAAREGRFISHYSPEANLLDMLESLMKEFGDQGRGMHRQYVHDAETAEATGCREGTFTPWTPIPADTDILVYEGLHGCFLSETLHIADYVDLKIGVVPIVNLEWMQKMHRDTHRRGYSPEAVLDAVERRLADYVNYITPQFSLTDINFQRIPMVDTSNPFEGQQLPTLDESKVVVRFSDPKRMPFTLPQLLERIPGSLMSRRNSIVIPGRELELAMELILEPLAAELLSKRRFGV